MSTTEGGRGTLRMVRLALFFDKDEDGKDDNDDNEDDDDDEEVENEKDGV